MCGSCRLLVLASVAVAVMACGVSPAYSQVEVSDEATGSHCDPVTIDQHHNVGGGCRVRAVSESETRIQTFVSGVGFITITTCEDQLEAAIGEDGTGYLYEASIYGHQDPWCPLGQCGEAFNGAQDTNATIPSPLDLASGSIEMTYCSGSPAGGGLACHTNVEIIDDGDHQYEFRATGAFGSGSCENVGGGVRIIGHWSVAPDEDHPAIEIG